MLTREGQIQGVSGSTHPLSSFTWSGASIVDACAIQADFGHLLVLTADGALHAINLDEVTCACLCTVALPGLPPGEDGSFFGTPRYRLHSSSDGRHAAIVIDNGKHGTVVDVRTGTTTMSLNGGDYCEETVPFSACILCYEGRNVLVHRTSWNRLDVADPATGEPLTARHIAEHKSGGERPTHYLDYFHGRLRPSPSGKLIFDDGWVWHPFAVARVWSVTDWLSANPFESEDGASVVALATREDWTTPACWIDERHIALWGLAHWNVEETEETGHSRGVQIFDVADGKQPSVDRWPMDIQANKVFDLFSDGTHLFVAADTGTTVWNLASREQTGALPGFTARLLDLARNTLVAFGPDGITEFSRP